MHDVRLEFDDGSNIDLSFLTEEQAKAFVADFEEAIVQADAIKGRIFISDMIEDFDMGCRRTIATPGVKDDGRRRSHCQPQLGRWAVTDQDEEEKWKPVCEGTSRLSVPGGWLYRVDGANGFQLASIPYDDSDERDATRQQGRQEATFTYGRNQEARAIRTSDVGD